MVVLFANDLNENQLRNWILELKQSLLLKLYVFKEDSL